MRLARLSSIELSKLPPLLTLLLSTCRSENHEPVNRVMTVWSGEGRPTPNLACQVGFLSIETRNIWRTNCSQAHHYRKIGSVVSSKYVGVAG